MHNSSDQFCKSVLRDALSLTSVAETEVEVNAATQKIDVYSVPDPSREAARAGMGLLGELSAVPSMFEPYSQTPSFRQVKTCLRKQLAWIHELERRARKAAGVSAPDDDADADASLSEAVPSPALVVISPGRPETALRAFGCTSNRAGVYDAVAEWDVRVIVLAELPRTRDTLLLRLLGKGRHLLDAMADLKSLPASAWEASVVMPLLVHFKLSGDGSTTNEEDDVTSMEIRAWFEDWQQKQSAEAVERAIKQGLDQGIKQGLEQGLDQGIKQGARGALMRLLRVRFGELPASVVARVDVAEEGELQRWLDRVLTATTLDDVLVEPS